MEPSINTAHLAMSGKVAVVTGGLSGIGLAIADHFQQQGAYAVIRADLAAASDTIADTAENSIKVDVSNETSVDNLVSQVVAKYGRIDCLVNSAGIGQVTPFLDTDLKTFDRTIAVNLRGAFLVGQRVARVMRQTGGSILNIASVSGMMANAGRSAYGTSKASVILLSQAMAMELAPYGIRVNVLAPGPITTPLAQSAHSTATSAEWMSRVPLHRYGTTAEMATIATFLSSNDASYITGQVLAADGGFTTAGLTSQS